MDLTNQEIDGKTAARALDRAGLETNYNTVPYDPRKPLSPSGIRLGTPAVTSRGMGTADMDLIADWFRGAIDAAKKGDDDRLDQIKNEVTDLCRKFTAPGISVTR